MHLAPRCGVPPLTISCATPWVSSTSLQGVDGLGLGPGPHVACRQVLDVGRLCLLSKVFTGGNKQGRFQAATDSNLLLIKTVQKTFGKRLRDPALFMRGFNGRTGSCSRWMSAGPLQSVPLCFPLSLNKFGGCPV